MTTPEPVVPPEVHGPLAMDFIRKLTLATLALMVVVVAALSLYLMTYVREQRELSECYRQAFNETNSAIATSVAAAGRDRRGLLDMLTAISDPARTREQRAGDLETYRLLLARGEAERASNPLPNRIC